MDALKGAFPDQPFHSYVLDGGQMGWQELNFFISGYPVECIFNTFVNL